MKLSSPTIRQTKDTADSYFSRYFEYGMVDLPEPLSSVPRKQLLFSHPSPIEPLSRLTTELFSSRSHSGSETPSTRLWIKREDSNSGLAFGGNKIRKLEYVISDAILEGATTLVTTGGLQSNHMRQVAAAAAKCGLKVCILKQR